MEVCGNAPRGTLEVRRLADHEKGKSPLFLLNLLPSGMVCTDRTNRAAEMAQR